MIMAFFIAFITADIAEMLYDRLRGINFSIKRAIVYFFVINITFICYMLFIRRESFSTGVYYIGPKSVLRYTACALGLCAAVPLVSAAITGPKKIFAEFKRNVWLSLSIMFIIILSAGAYLTYKNTEAVSLTTDYQTYTEPAGS